MYTPTPDILKEPPEVGGCAYCDGDAIAEALSGMGVSCRLVEEVPSAQVVTYHFDLANPMDINRLKRPVKALGAIMHTNVLQVPSNVAHFGLMVARMSRSTVYLKSALPTRNFCIGRKKSRLCALLGTDTNADTLVCDVAQMPHILLAGSTGSGKSVCLNTIVASLLFNNLPTDMQLVMIDPKKVELSVYDGLPHLAVPVIKDFSGAVGHLRGLCTFMDKRYEQMAQRHARNAAECGLPSMVVVIDELADLMLTSRYEVEDSIIRLAQLGRAAGIHLIIATQRPTVNVITGLIKSNMPCRIALQTASMRDSMNILDHKGAEALTGKGDALLKLPDRVEEIRFQSAYTSTDDIERIVRYWRIENSRTA